MNRGSFAAVARCLVPCLAVGGLLNVAAGDAPRRSGVGPPPPGEPRGEQPPRRPPGNTLPHGAAELMTYGLTPEQFRELETTEMIALVGEIYRPDKPEQVKVAAEIGRIQAGRWENNPEIQPYADLIAKRAARFAALSQELKPTDSPWKKIRQLRRDPEFSKLQNEIRQYEYKHTHNLSGHIDRIEGLLEPGKVEEARQDWSRRVRSLRSSAQIPRLCDGLQTRKVAREKPEDSAVGAIAPGNGKPPSSAHADPRSRVGAPPSPKRGGGAESARAAAGEASRPLSEWEKYVVDFIERYDLTEAQSNSALAILRELSSRAAQIETMNRERRAAAEQIADPKTRQERLGALSRPIDDLFVQLKYRLDLLPSAEQRNRAKK